MVKLGKTATVVINATARIDSTRRQQVIAGVIFILALLAVVSLSTPSRAGEAAAEESVADGKFVHSKHSQIKCDQCHVRRADAIRPVVPGHRACISCHVKQFTSTQFGICSNCHEGITAVRPPVSPFPLRQTYGLEFSHKAHATYIGGQRRADCSECHVISGAMASFPGHKECYVCHKAPEQVKPGEKTAGASCDTCHTVAGSRARLAAGGLTYKTTRFSHAYHLQRGISCADCHGVVGDGAGQQVSQPLLSEHRGTKYGRSCGSCHNGVRAFGGELVHGEANCVRCHGRKMM
ncbi:MAG TPA: cytochrome c3 family protein [Blastocatellia bacterium]|nr:cytochrome c3 family protein [Blastocatellia bacterium]